MWGRVLLISKRQSSSLSIPYKEQKESSAHGPSSSPRARAFL